ncbi:hypothetical protein ACFY0F_15300 [Streptomyces sp. NPDC001544]|uniref:Rv1733c family protein n=1 Tax=Streptomyces sp. NPDC001544 TaxID=3364584 RepID=UPI003698E556
MTARAGRTTSPLWRWRGNPLRRHDDVLEAWIVLAVWLIVAIGGAIVGVVTARTVGDGFARERAERRPVRAVLLVDVPQTAGDHVVTDGDRVMAKVRWTVPDGSSRSSRTWVRPGQSAGAQLTVWTDARGRPTVQPRTGTQAAVEAGVYGGAAALALAGVTVGAGAGARYWLDRRRIDAWGREWELVGPRWSHRTR